MRLTDALARNAGDVGLNVPIEKKVKRAGGARARQQQLQQQQQADQSWAATMPPLRIDRVRGACHAMP